MDTNEILKIIFREHDRLSHAAVFDQDIADRDRAFVKAEAIRELISSVRAGFTKIDMRDAFNEAVVLHTEALGKGIFYNRTMNFNE